jgi:hypothetical protein
MNFVLKKTKADHTRWLRARRLWERHRFSAVQGHINTSFWLPEKTIKSLSASRCFIGSAPS